MELGKAWRITKHMLVWRAREVFSSRASLEEEVEIPACEAAASAGEAAEVYVSPEEADLQCLRPEQQWRHQQQPCVDGDGGSNNSYGERGASTHPSGPSSSSFSSSSNSSSDEGLEVAWKDARAHPFDPDKRSSRDARIGGVVLGVAHPFDRGTSSRCLCFQIWYTYCSNFSFACVVVTRTDHILLEIRGRSQQAQQRHCKPLFSDHNDLLHTDEEH